jgi:hypothetical protein
MVLLPPEPDAFAALMGRIRTAWRRSSEATEELAKGGLDALAARCRGAMRRSLGGLLLQKLLADLGVKLDDLDAARAAFGALAVSAQGLALGVVIDDRETVRGAL